MKMFNVMRTFDESLKEVEMYKPPISESKTRDITGFALNYKDFAPYIARKIEDFISNTAPKHKISGLYLIDSICKAKGGVNETYKQYFGLNLASTVSAVLVPELTEKQRESVKKVVRIWNERKLFPTEIIVKLALVLKEKLNYFIPGLDVKGMDSDVEGLLIRYNPPGVAQTSSNVVGTRDDGPVSAVTNEGQGLSTSLHFPQFEVGLGDGTANLSSLSSQSAAKKYSYSGFTSIAPAGDFKHLQSKSSKNSAATTVGMAAAVSNSNISALPPMEGDAESLGAASHAVDKKGDIKQQPNYSALQPSSHSFNVNMQVQVPSLIQSDQMQAKALSDQVQAKALSKGVSMANEDNSAIDNEAIKNLATAFPLSFNIPLVRPLPFKLLDLVSSQEQQEEEQVDPKKVIESRNRREIDARMMHQKQMEDERLVASREALDQKQQLQPQLQQYPYQIPPQHVQQDGGNELKNESIWPISQLHQSEMGFGESNREGGHLNAYPEGIRTNDQSQGDIRMRNDGHFRAEDRGVDLHFSRATNAPPRAGDKNQSSTLFIGNLAPTVTESIMHFIFDPYGTVENVFLKLDKQFAFVTFSSHEEAQTAKQCESDRVVEGRPIRIGWGRNIGPKQSSTVFSGDGGGRGEQQEGFNSGEHAQTDERMNYRRRSLDTVDDAAESNNYHRKRRFERDHFLPHQNYRRKSNGNEQPQQQYLRGEGENFQNNNDPNEFENYMRAADFQSGGSRNELENDYSRFDNREMNELYHHRDYYHHHGAYVNYNRPEFENYTPEKKKP